MNSKLDICRALADESRLRILALVEKTELSIGELGDILQQSQPRISRHVKILCDAGLTHKRREGICFFITSSREPRLTPLYSALNQLECESALEQEDRTRLLGIHEKRASIAQDYFDKNASQWNEMRALHIDEAQVEAAILAILATHKMAKLLDIGTGTGRILEILSAKAEHCTGIDRNAEMLRFARAKLAQAQIHNVDLCQGDLNSLALANQSMDTIVLHQVLHFLDTPEQAFAEIARVMAPHGRFLLVDFAAHDLEILRTRHAHARLGFTHAQIESYCTQNGLRIESSQACAGSPLTVQLWLIKHKESRHG
jgi:ubiquinone/menaquinone biosynthesis C-methylase UbiE/DNA-binding transcriptional ArsR family regulator